MSGGWRDTLEARTYRAADGTRVAYETLGRGERVLLLANGLGGRLYSWEPLLERFWSEYRVITWDYRGLFASDSPPSDRQLALFHHASDALGILDAEKVDKAVFVGWSMGVQVSLDVAASSTDRVAGLVLLNGTHGHAMSTGLQPLFPIPLMARRMHAFVEFLYDRPHLAQSLAQVSRSLQVPMMAVMGLTAGKRAFTMGPVLQRYFDDVLGESFRNYLRLFQELDAHSVYHVLRYIESPALIISGRMDVMTPAYQSSEMARRMPNAEHLALTRASHFALLERPEVVLPAIEKFLGARARYT